MKICWPLSGKENWNGMVMWQEPVVYWRLSSKVQFKVEEEGAHRERNGRTLKTALPQPKPLPMTVKGGDSWCSVHQCSTPMTLERVKGLVIVSGHICKSFNMSTLRVLAWMIAVVFWTSQQHAKCISGTHLLRQLYMLPHWDRSWRPVLPSHSILAPGQSVLPWPCNTRHLPWQSTNF